MSGPLFVIMRNCQSACKPGSVWPCKQDVVIIHLGQRLPATSTQPTRTIELKTALESPPHCPYSVLLPMGFTLPAPLLGRRWALTPPFHPYLDAQSTSGGGLLSVALSLGFATCFPSRVLPGIVFPWSPDFPPLHPFEISSSNHPADWHFRYRV